MRGGRCMHESSRHHSGSGNTARTRRRRRRARLGPQDAGDRRDAGRRAARSRVTPRSSRFLDRAGNPIDIGIALFFPGPHSYTGEHVLELQGHGGPVIVERLVERCLELGARRARPGEFTERAFHNDKIDLAQAEAVADLIDAGSREAARAAMRSLQGEFSSMVQGLTDALIDLRTYVEAAIDFPEEEVDFLGDAELQERLATVRGHFDGVSAAASQGRLLRDGMTVVLAGRPNSGKSSLLNRLAGYEAAIVTAIPGTTRDVLRERIDIDGLPLHVLDTAGLRDSDDVVEREGVRRAAAEMSRADRVLFVIDTSTDPARPRLRRGARAPAGRTCPSRWCSTRSTWAQDCRSRTPFRVRRASTCRPSPARASTCCART